MLHRSQSYPEFSALQGVPPPNVLSQPRKNRNLISDSTTACSSPNLQALHGVPPKPPTPSPFQGSLSNWTESNDTMDLVPPPATGNPEADANTNDVLTSSTMPTAHTTMSATHGTQVEDYNSSNTT